jgi:hypothetical protein
VQSGVNRFEVVDRIKPPMLVAKSGSDRPDRAYDAHLHLQVV